MERGHAGKPLLALVVLSFVVLLPLAASVPMPRSLRLGSQQTLKLVASQEAAMNLGRSAARMDVEVNDYPPAGANTKHDPPPPPPLRPGRA
ncbi:hypothetical protein U9M48_044364 [Paspalum notatum var. saurae]|uniref:Uncharacterized protein n=1 Tax=Paspalum notatum var. saurae TaxID=547442 RepID=A0AAQ3XHE6_PASNO